ncbi:MAG TPA: hypothetical protein VFG20_21325 [Planctomycetaceae bacterium]|nr:hypothetical protein [Planctomycetaceae bacterium]
MTPLRGIWIGDAERDEFRPVLSRLQRDKDLHWTLFSTVTQFAEAKPLSDAVIIGESWPDEFTADDVSRLITTAPLARMICITGAWSEAAGRTRSHWPPAWRVPLWDAVTRLERELTALRACQSGTTSTSFPAWTASRQETWLWQHTEFSPPVSPAAARTVCLEELTDPALAATLSEWLRCAGHRVDSQDADIVLLDADPWSPFLRDRLIRALARRSRSLAVALTAWNTPSLREELAAIGITHVADKLSPESLLRVLSEVPSVTI